MPWKLIGILVILVLFLLFSGFNVHKVTIFFGPMAIADVPLFVIIITSFILGAITALPFTIIKSVKKAYKIRKKLENKNQIDQKKEGEKELIQGPVDQQNLTNTEKNTGKEEKKKRKTRKK